MLVRGLSLILLLGCRSETVCPDEFEADRDGDCVGYDADESSSPDETDTTSPNGTEEGGGGADFLNDEEAYGGGDDGWRPSASVTLDCEWLPQVQQVR